MNTIPQEQRALILESKQGDIVLGTRTLPIPIARRLLIKIKSTSLNPIDWKIQRYGTFVEKYPAVLGLDTAGEVVGLGEDVTKFKIGDRVVSHGSLDNEFASFQEYTLADEYHACKIPSNITYDQACTLPVTLTCAYVGLYNVHPYGLGLASPVDRSQRGRYKGVPFVVFGGATSVGKFVIQLLRLSGFSPIIATASLKHTDFLKSLGATNVLDRNLPVSSLKVEISKITSEPIKYAYDTVSQPETQPVAVEVVAPGGHLALARVPAITLPSDKSVVEVIGTRRLPHNVQLLSILYERLEEWLEKGILQPPNLEVLPGGLTGIVDGFKRLELDQVSGFKLVARPEETPAS